ncbi:MAG: MBL fold metallo-hydrolase [Prevotellaceae bacterium]|jgi:glyoxylase-like metal-dependent hydrolase (beta-lactamase superfamily II)|nr:MBL fold metallo-hydrolase [Prevotellaceae bacterium]
MQIKIFYFNELRVCTYVLWDDTRECVIVDCGCGNENECSRLQKFIADNNLKPVLLLNTHGHFDHAMGNAFLANTYNIKSYIHAGDKEMLAQTANIAMSFGYKTKNPPPPDGKLEDGQILHFGQSQLQVLHTPGHSKGSVCFYSPEEHFILTGDLLFQACIGRTDLPGGDYDEIMESLSKKIAPLPENTVIYPGHGPATTIREEKLMNPYIAEFN